MKILIVEDNPRLRSLVGEHLAGAGLVVDEVGTGEDCLAALSTNSYDALLLDLGLPDADGAQILREARERTSGRLPIVIITARDELSERVRLLNAGADDFIVKPFDMAELAARVRAVLRRPGTRSTNTLRFGDLEFDVSRREALVHSRPMDLARRELGLLEELLRADGRIVIREALEDRLYAFKDPVTPNAIEQSISRLRRALSLSGSIVEISTKRGLGYRLSQRDVKTAAVQEG